MASATHPLALSFHLPRFTLPKHCTPHRLSLSSSSSSSSMSSPIRRRSTALLRGRRPPDSARSAYVTGPPSDPIVTDSVPKVDVSSSDGESRQSPPKVITWGLLWSLLLRHKLRIAVSMATLVGCSACTLAMPLYSGKFFEVLIGTTPKPLWNVLSKVAVLYALEPILTVIFVVNLNTIWEKVMSNLRAQIFQRVLIQKVEFFDRYKVWNRILLLLLLLQSRVRNETKPE